MKIGDTLIHISGNESIVINIFESGFYHEWNNIRLHSHWNCEKFYTVKS